MIDKVISTICSYDIYSQKTTYPPYKKIGEWIEQNPKFLTKDYNGITNNIVKNHCVHLGVK